MGDWQVPRSPKHVNNLLLEPDSGGDGQLQSVHSAIEKGDDLAVKELIESKADVDCTDSYGRTPLGLALRHSRRQVVAYLVQAGATCSLDLLVEALTTNPFCAEDLLDNLLVERRHPASLGYIGMDVRTTLCASSDVCEDQTLVPEKPQQSIQWQTPVAVKVFLIEDVASIRVVKALAACPLGLLSTTAARGIVLQIWWQVRRWYYLDLCLAVLFVVGLSVIVAADIAVRSAAGTDFWREDFRGNALVTFRIVAVALIGIVAKDAIDEGLQVWANRTSRGRIFIHSLYDYLRIGTDLAGLACLWMSNFYTYSRPDSLERELEFEFFFIQLPIGISSTTRCIVAVWILFRWVHLFYMLCHTFVFGPHILPILAAVYETKTIFSVAFFFMLCATSMSLWMNPVAAGDPLGVVQLVFGLNMFGDNTNPADVIPQGSQRMTNEEYGNDSFINAMTVLYYALGILSSVVLLNLLIGILGSNFERAEDSRMALHTQKLSSMIMILCSRPWALRASKQAGFLWLAHGVDVDDNELRSCRTYMSAQFAALRQFQEELNANAIRELRSDVLKVARTSAHDQAMDETTDHANDLTGPHEHVRL